jgi:hypothetical protein
MYKLSSSVVVWDMLHNVLEHLQRCLVCEPAEVFCTSKFSYVLFCNPTNKTETGKANRWGEY